MSFLSKTLHWLPIPVSVYAKVHKACIVLGVLAFCYKDHFIINISFPNIVSISCPGATVIFIINSTENKEIELVMCLLIILLL